MATIDKDFKIKNGLVVEGSNATVNGNQILTEVDGDAYILDLIGGETLINSVDADDFTVTAGNLEIASGSDLARTGDITNAIDALTTADIEEGLGNQYFTDTRARGAVSGGTGLDYNSSTGVFDIDSTVTTNTGTQTLENKTISYADNTITVQVSNVSDLTASASELNTLDGITASTSELNLLDGVTATTAELNTLAGITATTTELNYVDGVTSSIQNQLDDKAPLDSPALTGTPTAPTATAGTNTTQVATTAFVSTAVANVVGAAPELLDTLEELALAMDNDPNLIANLNNIASGKQDALTAGNGIVIDGDDIIYVPTYPGSGISVTPQEVEIDRTTVDGWYDTNGAASDVQDNLDTHTNASSAHGVSGDIVGTSGSQTLTGKTISGSNNTLSDIGNSSLTNDSITVNGYSTALGSSVTLNTDDVSDAGSTNKYYTDAQVRDVLTTATQINISITEDGNELIIEAENGVADSTTDDLTEGSTRLYFTDQRAIDAITDATIYPTIVDINDYRREEATQQYVASASTVTAHTFTGNKSAKYLVRTVGNVSGTLHSQITELLVTVDGNNNAAVTEYGTIYTSENPLATATMDYSGGEHRLRVTTTILGAEVVVAATILNWAD